MKLFLCGDVMTGRGIDQILAAPCAPQIEEPWVKDARDYVELAERVNGSVPRGAGIRTAGAGRNAFEAAAPAILDAPAGGRVLVFAYGLESSGVPAAWAAAEGRPGVSFLPGLSAASAEDAAWLAGVLRRVSGTNVERAPGNRLRLQ